MKNYNLINVRKKHQNEVSKKICDVLVYRQKSVTQISEIMGKSKGALSNWKNGRGLPSALDIALFCDVTDISVEYFLEPGMTLKEADLLIKRKPVNDMDKLLKSVHWSDKRGFSRERLQTAEALTDVPEEYLPFLNRVMDSLTESLPQRSRSKDV